MVMMVMMSDLNFVDGRIVLEVLYVSVRALGGSGDKVYLVNKDQKEKREEEEKEVILVIRDHLETVKVCFQLLILALKQNRKE